jgi:hypothetical protein
VAELEAAACARDVQTRSREAAADQEMWAVRRHGTTRVTRISPLHLSRLVCRLQCVSGASKPNGLAAWPMPFASLVACAAAAQIRRCGARKQACCLPLIGQCGQSAVAIGGSRWFGVLVGPR